MPITESVPYDQIQPIEQGLINAFPLPIQFHTREEIENLTAPQAMEVMRAARRMLLMTLLTQEHHEHMLDDCGDDLDAATHNWHRLHNAYFANDGTDFEIHVRDWLLNKDDEGLGGSDGEIRYELLDRDLIEAIYFPGEAG